MSLTCVLEVLRASCLFLSFSVFPRRWICCLLLPKFFPPSRGCGKLANVKRMCLSSPDYAAARIFFVGGRHDGQKIWRVYTRLCTRNRRNAYGVGSLQPRSWGESRAQWGMREHPPPNIPRLPVAPRWLPAAAVVVLNALLFLLLCTFFAVP